MREKEEKISKRRDEQFEKEYLERGPRFRVAHAFESPASPQAALLRRVLVAAV